MENSGQKSPKERYYPLQSPYEGSAPSPSFAAPSHRNSVLSTSQLPPLAMEPRSNNVDIAAIEAMAFSRCEVYVPDERPAKEGQDDDGDHGEIAPTPWWSINWRTLWGYAGPGWLMSIAYLDPGNLESDLQAGAYAEYQLLWMLLLATCLGLFFQTLAARLGVVTGKNLAETCHIQYPRWASLVVYFMTEIAIIGSDIQEVLGTAIAFRILFNLPLYAGCLITACDTFTFLLLHHFGIRKLEAFFALLISIMFVCFAINFSKSQVDGKVMAKGLFVPHIETYAYTQAVGMIGCVIMPHNLYLHSGLVQSRYVDRKNPTKVREANKYFGIESAIAIFIAFFINLTVVGAFANGFFSKDCLSTYDSFNVNTACFPVIEDHKVADSPYPACTLQNGVAGICQEIGLLDAGVALRGFLGSSAEYIWAIGLLAAGQSSTMTGTYAGQFVMEGFLSLKWAPWKRVLLTRTIALGPALAVAIYTESQEGLSDKIGEMLNVLQSIQLPFALFPVLYFTCNSNIMGTRFVNGFKTKLVGYCGGLFVIGINLYLVIHNVIESHDNLSTIALCGIGLAGVLYVGFISYLMHWDIKHFYQWIKSFFQR